MSAMTRTIISSGRPTLKGTGSAYRAPGHAMRGLGGEDRRGELDVPGVAQRADRGSVDVEAERLDRGDGAGASVVDGRADLGERDVVAPARRVRRRPAAVGHGLRERAGVLG